MNRNQSIYRMAVGALLIAVGILIPMIMPFPLKIAIPPMSFTLASHVAIFLAMFLSPAIAFGVAIGTTVGFVFSGLPPEVWLRALTHVVWAVLGAFYLKKNPELLHQPVKSVVFCAVVAVVHAALEVAVVLTLYFGGIAGAAQKWGEAGFTGILLLVGLGAVVHSSVDFVLSALIWQPLRHVSGVQSVAAVR